MKILLINVLIFLLFICNVQANDAENIQACVSSAKKYANINLDPYLASYTGNIFSFSIVKWQNATCDVKLANVYDLSINGHDVIYKSFAGKDAYELNEKLNDKIKEAISILSSRISILKQRANIVEASLQDPHPDFDSAVELVEEAIERTLNISSEINMINSSTPNFVATSKKSDENDKLESVNNTKIKKKRIAPSYKNCVEKGVEYYIELGSYPTLSNGEDATQKAQSNCSRTTTAFGFNYQ